MAETMRAWRVTRYGEPSDVLSLDEVPRPHPAPASAGPGERGRRELPGRAAGPWPVPGAPRAAVQVGIELQWDGRRAGSRRHRTSRRRSGRRVEDRRAQRVRGAAGGRCTHGARHADRRPGRRPDHRVPDRVVCAAPAREAAAGGVAAGPCGGRRCRRGRRPARGRRGRPGDRGRRVSGEGGGRSGPRCRRTAWCAGWTRSPTGCETSRPGHGADVVFDPVGGDAFRASTRCIAFEGRIVLVGFAGGEIPTSGSATLCCGTTAFSGSTGGCTQPPARTWWTTRTERSTRWWTSGAIEPLVDSVVPFERRLRRSSGSPTV